MFSVFVSYKGNELQCVDTKFLDDTKLGKWLIQWRVVLLFRDANKAEKWADRNVKFNIENFKVLYLRRNNLVYQYTLDLTGKKAAFQKRTWKLNMNMSQELPKVKKASCILACMSKIADIAGLAGWPFVSI